MVLLATGSHDSTVRLWNPDIADFRGHTDWISALAAIPLLNRSAVHAIGFTRCGNGIAIHFATLNVSNCSRMARLDELARHPNAPDERLRMVEVARQSIQASRADLPAPAQSVAANLADHLLRRLFVPVDGKYAYKATSKRVTGLSAQISTLSMSFGDPARVRHTHAGSQVVDRVVAEQGHAAARHVQPACSFGVLSPMRTPVRRLPIDRRRTVVCLMSLTRCYHR
jgi:hypothetical protein